MPSSRRALFLDSARSLDEIVAQFHLQCSVPARPYSRRRQRNKRIKVFWFFFSKKNCFFFYWAKLAHEPEMPASDCFE